jgi:hypothetical protein
MPAQIGFSSRASRSTSSVTRQYAETVIGTWRPAAPSRTRAVAAASGAGATPDSRITPSAISPASRRLRGPLAATWMGTGTGLRSRAVVPANSTSLPSSRSRISCTPARRAAPVLGGSPMGSTELLPTPTPSTKRPGAVSATVRAADATTDGCRVATLVTAVPTVIRDVAASAAAATGNTSRHSSCESGNHTSSIPTSSARAANAASCGTGRHGGTRSPILMRGTCGRGR